MLQRLIAAVLGVLGLLTIGLGVASSTVWRGDDVLVATASPDAHLVVADPGVLELAGNPVTVTVHAANDAPVVIVVGRDTDVAGWVGTDAHAQVTGLASWHALQTEAVAEQPPTPAASVAPGAAATEPAPTEPAPSEPAASDASASATGKAAGGATAAVADPTGSDLWVAQATGNGTATLTWDAQPGRWSLLVASLGESSPVVELAWPRTVTTPWLWPGVVGGVLLVLAGLGLGARLWLRARRGLTEPEWHPVLTGAMPTVDVAGARPGAAAGADSADAVEPVVLTRRQLRDAEAAAATRRRGRGASSTALTGAQPLLVPAGGSEAPTEDPTRLGDAPRSVAVGWPPAPGPAREPGPAVVAGPSTGPARAAGQPPTTERPAEHLPSGAHREAQDGTTIPPVKREQHHEASPTPSVYGSWAYPAQPSAVPVTPQASPPQAPAGSPSSTAALPSYFLRPAAPGTGRTSPDAPVAPGGWVPGASTPESPAPRPGADHGATASAADHVTARRHHAAADDAEGMRRPTWAAAKPPLPVQPTDEPPVEPPSARADAWRRAWGFPGHDVDEPDDAARDTDEGTHR